MAPVALDGRQATPGLSSWVPHTGVPDKPAVGLLGWRTSVFCSCGCRTRCKILLFAAAKPAGRLIGGAFKSPTHPIAKSPTVLPSRLFLPPDPPRHLERQPTAG